MWHDSNSTNPCWERLEQIMYHYHFRTTSEFSRFLELKHPENLYQIKRGNNRISFSLANRICEHLPELSKAWVLTGETAMIPPLDKTAAPSRIGYGIH